MFSKRFEKKAFKAAVKDNVKTLYRKTIDEATPQQLFQAVSYAVKDVIIDDWIETQKRYDETDAKTVYYMSMEFLMGRALGNNLINITAYKDELPPRILVQVKSQDSDIKETTIQSLKGAMREGDYGLFVTLSNYTKNAQKYLDSTPIIRGINGTELVDLILKYYEDLSEKYRKMIPLKMVYIPVPKEDA